MASPLCNAFVSYDQGDISANLPWFPMKGMRKTRHAPPFRIRTFTQWLRDAQSSIFPPYISHAPKCATLTLKKNIPSNSNRSVEQGCIKEFEYPPKFQQLTALGEV